MSATENARINVWINNKVVGGSLTAIRSQYRDLNKEIAGMRVGSEEYNRTVKAIAQRKDILDKHTKAIRGTKQAWSDAKRVMLGVIGANIGMQLFQSITEFIPKMINGNAKLSDSFADVRKNANLTAEEMQSLYSKLGNIDTRTSRARLLEIARDVGKSGVEGVNNIASVVEQADKIDVALGDALGDDALKNLVKLNTQFKTSEIFGYADALNMAGSAINELGANSVANEGYIVNFSTRLAGAATQANMTQSEVFGIASTLDILGQRVEASGTAVQTTIVDMFKDTGAFAKIAKMEVGDFAKLLNTDANEALLKVLEGINGNNEGMGMLVKRLSNLGVDGSRATQVLSALAGNTKLLREQQQLANNSYNEATSLTTEFNIKNDNLAGTLEKIGKRLRSIWMNPALKEGINNAVTGFAKLIEKDPTKAIISQGQATQVLIQKIMRLNPQNEERIKAINYLKREYPGLLSNIQAEQVTNEQLASSITKVNQATVRRLIIARKEEDLTEVNEKMADAIERQIAAEDKLNAQRDRVGQLIKDPKANADFVAREMDALNMVQIEMMKASSTMEGSLLAANRLMQNFGVNPQAAQEIVKLNDIWNEWLTETMTVGSVERETDAIIAEIDKLTDKLAGIPQAVNNATEDGGQDFKFIPGVDKAQAETDIAETIDNVRLVAQTLRLTAQQEMDLLLEALATKDELTYSEVLELYKNYLQDVKDETVQHEKDIDEVFQRVNRNRAKQLKTWLKQSNEELVGSNTKEDRIRQDHYTRGLAGYSNFLAQFSEKSATAASYAKGLALAEVITSQAVAAANALKAIKGVTAIDYIAQIGIVLGAIGTTFNRIQNGLDAAMIPTTPAFATGTTNLRHSGPVLTGEKGKELVRTPNNEYYMAGVRGPELGSFPLGSQIFSADATRQIMSSINSAGPSFSRSLLTDPLTSGASADSHEIKALLHELVKNTKPTYEQHNRSKRYKNNVRSYVNIREFERMSDRLDRVRSRAALRKG